MARRVGSRSAKEITPTTKPTRTSRVKHAGADPADGKERDEHQRRHPKLAPRGEQGTGQRARDREMVGIQAGVRWVWEQRVDGQDEEWSRAVVQVAQGDVEDKAHAGSEEPDDEHGATIRSPAPVGQPGDDDQPHDGDQRCEREEPCEVGPEWIGREPVVERPEDEVIHRGRHRAWARGAVPDPISGASRP